LTEKQLILIEYPLIYLIIVSTSADYLIGFRYLQSVLQVQRPNLVKPLIGFYCANLLIMYTYFAYLTGYTANFIITTQFTIKELFSHFVHDMGWGIPALMRSLFISVLWLMTIEWLILFAVLLIAVLLLKKLIINFNLSNSN
jgi:hypothetical protein